MPFRALAAAGLLWLAAPPPPAVAEDPTAELAERLIAMRGEVEALNRELELLREESRTTLAGLAAQRAELEASLGRQELALREQRERLEKARAAGAQSGVGAEALLPVLIEALERLAEFVRQALPFRSEDRLQAIADLRQQLEAGLIPPPRAANRLWALVEDELRIARENGIYSQTIPLGGEKVLADVAKLGSVMLFFRTADRRVGRAVPSAEGWRFELLEDAADRERVLALFDALRKQIRQGYFQLPGGMRFAEFSE
jgi:hypothetical protein